MNEGTVNRYAQMAERKERDPYGPDGSGRAVVVNGRGFKNWKRFHKGEQTVWVENAVGQRYELTPSQYSIYRYVSTHYGTPIPMRSIAAQMKLAPSTVSRAMVRLASFGLIAYLTGRGRYAVTVVIERVRNDGMDRFRRAAQAKARLWRLAAEKRISRLRDNVALYSLDRGRGTDSLYWYFSSSTKGATLTAQLAWTPQEIEESLR